MRLCLPERGSGRFWETAEIGHARLLLNHPASPQTRERVAIGAVAPGLRCWEPTCRPAGSLADGARRRSWLRSTTCMIYGVCCSIWATGGDALSGRMRGIVGHVTGVLQAGCSASQRGGVVESQNSLQRTQRPSNIVGRPTSYWR